MDLEVKKFLFDIKESIGSIEEYLGDKRDFNIYIADKMLRTVVATFQIYSIFVTNNTVRR